MRIALAAAIALLVAVAALFALELHERSALPAAANRFVTAIGPASDVTDCMLEVIDHLPDQGHPKPVEVEHALARLQSCDTGPLEAAIKRVDMPLAPPITNKNRRAARNALEHGLSQLRRIVAITASAYRTADAQATAGRNPIGTVDRAFRQASAAAVTAATDAHIALTRLGKCNPQGRQAPGCQPK